MTEISDNDVRQHIKNLLPSILQYFREKFYLEMIDIDDKQIILNVYANLLGHFVCKAIIDIVQAVGMDYDKSMSFKDDLLNTIQEILINSLYKNEDLLCPQQDYLN